MQNWFGQTDCIAYCSSSDTVSLHPANHQRQQDTGRSGSRSEGALHLRHWLHHNQWQCNAGVSSNWKVEQYRTRLRQRWVSITSLILSASLFLYHSGVTYLKLEIVFSSNFASFSGRWRHGPDRAHNAAFGFALYSLGIVEIFWFQNKTKQSYCWCFLSHASEVFWSFFVVVVVFCF